ncbi:hypothetical protein EJ04DRAFT_581168 [Polyplosphaeria fusca]|uniref:C2H2-type domain-containing protein n=1 Tax=Polyplosphaeria fusca TaxID=682080 RepID=A0A9P4UVX7_9PLEO|nr:hypothetical protein EJ04DRAFT_581168 [Polyplosphaeria fusca]
MEAPHVAMRQAQYIPASHAALPKLRTAGDSLRRDSIASSKTGDSGYNSDPDISLSPLDFVRPDNVPWSNGVPLQPVFVSEPLEAVETTISLLNRPSSKTPYLPSLDRCRHESNIPATRPQVTSDPFKGQGSKLQWTAGFKAKIEIERVLSIQKDSNRKQNVEQWMNESFPAHDRPDERKLSIASLSSTESCSIYSATDSEDDQTITMEPINLPKATIKTIELIMRKIEINLRYAAYIQCAGQSSQNSTSAPESSRGGRSTQPSGGKRKSRPDDGPDDDPDEDGANKRRRVSITTTEDSEAGPRFACPFYKHDPNRYRNRRTCPGPGWPTVHRMKEHLYRSHAQPISCPRCYQMFDADSDLSNHLRTQPCDNASPQPVEGIDRETLKTLRRRSPPLKLEEDKWRDTYQLLFPSVPEQDIPSPYYDNNSPTEESRRFRRELLDRIRRELFATAEQEASPVEQRLLRRVASIIQRCETDLLSGFHRTPSVPHPQPPALRPVPVPTLPLPTSGPSGRRRSAQAALETSSTSGPMLDAPPGPPHNAGLPFGVPSQFSQYFNDLPEVPNTFGGPAWEDPLPLPSSSLIDWDAVFQVPGEQGGEGNGPVSLFSAEVFSR